MPSWRCLFAVPSPRVGMEGFLLLLARIVAELVFLPERGTAGGPAAVDSGSGPRPVCHRGALGYALLMGETLLMQIRMWHRMDASKSVKVMSAELTTCPLGKGDK